jgi:hypothetical protein
LQGLAFRESTALFRPICYARPGLDPKGEPAAVVNRGSCPETAQDDGRAPKEGPETATSEDTCDRPQRFALEGLRLSLGVGELGARSR